MAPLFKTPAAAMTKCECHDVPFSRVAQYSRETGVKDLDTLCDRVGCGNVCTACRCDMKDYLAEQNRTVQEPAFQLNPFRKPA